MLPRRIASLASVRRSFSALFVAFAIAVAACAGDDERARPTSTTTTSSTLPASTTTTLVADLSAARVTLTPVADVADGTAMAVRAGDPALYLTVQDGRVLAVRNGQLDPTPVLDISDRVRNGGEQGLLGLVFSEDGTKLYVHFSSRTGAGAAGEGRVEQFAFVNGVADPASARVLLTVPDPQSNHNGGQLAFGPDGMLYISLGDGGSQGDTGSGHAPGGNAQSLDELLGKILRIDPRPTADAPYRIPADNPFATRGGRPEIWSYGLRNPWRFSFDRGTGDLWIGDVGAGAREEVDLATGPDAGRGVNYGWNRFEGSRATGIEPAPSDATPPVHEITHADGNCSITGGYVYRGSRIPDLVGSYVFTDYCNGAIRAIRVDGGRVVVARDLGIPMGQVSSFGEDGSGELYVISQSDGLFRIDPA